MKIKHTEPEYLSYAEAIYKHCLAALKTPEYAQYFFDGMTEKNFEVFVKDRIQTAKTDDDKRIVEDFTKNIISDNPYKPFINFIRGKTLKIAREEALKMLAFLFDFKPRSKVAYNANPIPKPPYIEAEPIEPEASHQIPPEKAALGSNSINKIIYLLVFIAFLLLIAVVSGIFNKPSTQIGNQINAGTFNVNKNYYYYLDSGKVKLIDKNLLTQKDDVHAKTLTPIVLDRYFLEQGLDTTQQKIKLIKVNYFNNHPEIPIIDVDNERVINREPVHKIKKVATDKKQAAHKPTRQREITKALSIDAVDIRFGDTKDDAVAGIIYNWLQKKSQNDVTKLNGTTQYSYRKSTNQKRDICDLTLNATIQSTSGNKVIHKTITGTGFSQRTAKQNAVMKLEKYINSR